MFDYLLSKHECGWIEVRMKGRKMVISGRFWWRSLPAWKFQAKFSRIFDDRETCWGCFLGVNFQKKQAMLGFWRGWQNVKSRARLLKALLLVLVVWEPSWSFFQFLHHWEASRNSVFGLITYWLMYFMNDPWNSIRHFDMQIEHYKNPSLITFWNLITEIYLQNNPNATQLQM